MKSPKRNKTEKVVSEVTPLSPAKKFKEDDKLLPMNINPVVPNFKPIAHDENLNYEDDFTILPPWERELNIEQFQKRMEEINIHNGLMQRSQNNNENKARKEYSYNTERPRTLSTIFE